MATPPDLREIEQKLNDVQEAKKSAVEEQRFEEAGRLRDQEKSLLEEKAAKETEVKASGVDLFDEVDEEAVAEVLSIWTGIPVYKLTEEETQKLIHMEDELHKRIIGQESAVAAVSQSIRRTRAGLKDPKRPSGSFIFLGPTGVGKTELAKTLAEFLFGDDNALITLDMSEYMEKHTVSRLVGSPPGYVGYEEGGQLTEAVRRKPFSVVLFDEIEKAHPDVFNTLLQILEEGRLTDSQGRSVDFRNTVLIMTSNLGTQDLRKANVGFTTADSAMSYERMKEKVMDALKLHFRPEFLNRIDEVIVFHELNRAEVLQMVDNLTRRLTTQLEGQGLGIELTQSAKELLARKGYDPQLGARPLRRAIQRLVEDPLSEMLLFKQFHAGEIVVVDTEDDPEKPGEQRISFSSVEGFVPPAAVELATTATASTHQLKPRPGDEPATEPTPTPTRPSTDTRSIDPATAAAPRVRRPSPFRAGCAAAGRHHVPSAPMRFSVWPSLVPALVRRPGRRRPRRGHRAGTASTSPTTSWATASAAGGTVTPMLEATGAMSALAVATDRVRLGSLVFGITYRHPAVLANWATTVDQISGGRLLLGVGAGWQINEHEQYGIELGPPGVRIDRFVEALDVLTGLLREPVTTVAGQYYTLDRRRGRAQAGADTPADPHRRQGRPDDGRRRPLRRRVEHVGAARRSSPSGRRCSTTAAWPSTATRPRSPARARRCGSSPTTRPRPTRSIARTAPRPAVGGTVERLIEAVQGWADVGVDEVIVPDFTLGTGDRAARAARHDHRGDRARLPLTPAILSPRGPPAPAPARPGGRAGGLSGRRRRRPGDRRRRHG